MKSKAMSRTILVTGATGYVGGRLVPRLLDAGYRVRCLVRDRRKVSSRTWIGRDGVEVVEGDIADRTRLISSLEGCDAAYYLVHSMISAGSDYRDQDRVLAGMFARAAAEAKVGRIIYLGGLGETGSDLSEHLTSRREVERALAAGPVPVTVLRAAMIVGAGSASFEILRYLVERLPVMVTPRWVGTRCQPISIQDALHYLVACLDSPETVGQVLDIGGPEVLTYREIMDRTARILGIKRRLIVPVPVLTPWLSSLWIHLVTPVGARIARPLAEGLRNPVVCRDDRAQELMPTRRATVEEAVAAAMKMDKGGEWESSWTDAGVVPGDPDWAGGTVYEDRRSTRVAAPAGSAFEAVCRIGGRYGWYETDWLWRVRGWMDRLLGGPGLARGRRRPDRIAYGDVLDFWRVSEIDPGRRLELRAEMRLPGTATLEFTVIPWKDRSEVIQTARFRPRGLPGLLYWFAVKPFHGFVFHSMLQGIRRRAEEGSESKNGTIPHVLARRRSGL